MVLAGYCAELYTELIHTVYKISCQAQEAALPHATHLHLTAVHLHVHVQDMPQCAAEAAIVDVRTLCPQAPVSRV